ncbi:HEPN domain-containing protein [Bacillus paranthracis]
MTDEEFFNIFVRPLTLPNFDIWFNYVGILRSKQLVEEQYLIYARCLEIISRDNVDTKIYKDAERRAKGKIYKELIEGMDLDENYKASLIEAFKFSNTKSFKVLLLQLIQNSSFTGQLELLMKGVKLDKLVGNIVNVRNHLTHGAPYEKIDTESLVFYEELIKQMVTYFILQEHGINAPLKIEHLYNNFEKLPEPLIK